MLLIGEVSGSTEWKDIPPQEGAEGDRAPSASYTVLSRNLFPGSWGFSLKVMFWVGLQK